MLTATEGCRRASSITIRISINNRAILGALDPALVAGILALLHVRPFSFSNEPPINAPGSLGEFCTVPMNRSQQLKHLR